ncbi:hypothetical protein BY996DRAFT_6409920 [Phakopsora pachyrhizi]|nr:hypothetical protein BY996DRAFT_6409920 [Phakopsora pachyrhizi]
MDLTQLLTPIKLTSSSLMQLLTWLPDWTRAIVSAVGGARAIHLSSAASPPTELDSLSSSNLDLLDFYTNFGICILVSNQGIQIFYSGQIAQQLVETINGDCGDVSIKDFSESIGQ